MPLHISPAWTDIVLGILRQHLPDRRVLAFGSRATGNRLKPHSDLDLCVMGPTPVPPHLFDTLRDAFSSSDLPIRVDIIDWATAPAFLRKAVEEQGIEFSCPTTTELNT